MKTLDECQRDYVQISDGTVIDRTTMKLVQGEKCHDEWTRSLRRSYVDTVTWHPAKLEITTANNRTALNLYRAPQMREAPSNWQDWAAPFKGLINHLFPIHQRRTATQWLGHVFQRPEQRPATAYMIKGDDIGPRTLARIIANALPDHTCLDATEGDYETRLAGRLFATAVNVRDGMAKHSFSWRRTVLEDDRKYGRYRSERNCCRWIFIQDKLPFDNRGRNVIVIEPATTAHPDYWRDLHAYMGKPQFVASVQRFLMTVDISSFDADGLAPEPPPKPIALKPRKPRKPNTGQAAWGAGGFLFVQDAQGAGRDAQSIGGAIAGRSHGARFRSRRNL